MAEETGQIIALGECMLRYACRQLARWAQHSNSRALTLSVNVSAVQIAHDDFVPTVMSIISDQGANPARLKLELTESLMAQDMPDIIAKMKHLAQFGVGFSLDDFGTGYSSLSYLRQLPLQQLKIDQSFVSDIDHQPEKSAIAEMIVNLADTMGLSVIAEGVETAGQFHTLIAIGCSHFQGYWFGRPETVGDFERRFIHLDPSP